MHALNAWWENNCWQYYMLEYDIILTECQRIYVYAESCVLYLLSCIKFKPSNQPHTHTHTTYTWQRRVVCGSAFVTLTNPLWLSTGTFGIRWKIHKHISPRVKYESIRERHSHLLFTSKPSTFYVYRVWRAFVVCRVIALKSPGVHTLKLTPRACHLSSWIRPMRPSVAALSGAKCANATGHKMHTNEHARTPPNGMHTHTHKSRMHEIIHMSVKLLGTARCAHLNAQSALVPRTYPPNGLRIYVRILSHIWFKCVLLSLLLRSPKQNKIECNTCLHK